MFETLRQIHWGRVVVGIIVNSVLSGAVFLFMYEADRIGSAPRVSVMTIVGLLMLGVFGAPFITGPLQILLTLPSIFISSILRSGERRSGAFLATYVVVFSFILSMPVYFYGFSVANSFLGAAIGISLGLPAMVGSKIGPGIAGVFAATMFIFFNIVIICIPWSTGIGSGLYLGTIPHHLDQISLGGAVHAFSKSGPPTIAIAQMLFGSGFIERWCR